MQDTVDRVMQAYGLMVDLCSDQEQEVRQILIGHLQGRKGSQQALAIEGLKFLRSHPLNRRFRTSFPRSSGKIQ